ncbi:MAG: GNAT family N-acetyltransferase [Streptosporangiaceae bacterium]
MAVTYRRLDEADWTQARDARLAALAEAPYAFGSTLDRELGFTAEVWRERAGSGRTVGAWHGSVIVGMATGLPEDARDGWHLVGMWVSPEWRGQDVASRLVAEVCAMARQAGAQAMTLWVTEVNARARAFYRKVGFQPTGARQLVRPEEPDHWEEELALRLDHASAGAATGRS